METKINSSEEKEITKKYQILDDEVKIIKKHTVHRIQALRDFDDVKKGDKGGWVSTIVNLSQNGNCWIYDDAVVYEHGYVEGDAKVKDHAVISGFGRVYGSAQVIGKAQIKNNAQIYGNAIVDGNKIVESTTNIFE